MIHLILVSVGYMSMFVHDIRIKRNWFAREDPRKQMILRINSTVKKRNNHYHGSAAVLYTFEKDHWIKTRGDLSVQFSAEIDSPLFLDVYYIKGILQPIPESKNPSFDYRKYMALKNIFYQCRISSAAVFKIEEGKKAISFHRFTEGLRLKILAVIDRYIAGPLENGLSKALLIGYRDGLDRDIISSYTNTGVIHVIAISGLHLGLIYALLAYCFKFLRKGLNTYRSVIIAAILWNFSILCGASPSVMRSALMFTCLLAGESLQKENYTANALAASAFILLCADPNLLWDIGFQLSYAAVGSLLIYNRWVSSLYNSSNIIINFAWNSVSTSIAAQILTTPLILFYFHQFPVLFLLANLIAVPLSGILLVLLILLCIIAPFPILATPIATITSWLASLMNLQINRLNRISFAVISKISFNLADAILCYACIFTASLFIISKKPAAALALLSVVLLWLVISASLYR